SHLWQRHRIAFSSLVNRRLNPTAAKIQSLPLVSLKTSHPSPKVSAVSAVSGIRHAQRAGEQIGPSSPGKRAEIAFDTRVNHARSYEQLSLQAAELSSGASA